MTKGLAIFCIGALAVALGLFAALFPYAAVPAQTLASSRVAQPMERMGAIDLGGGYGTVSVVDLVGYYVEHPPVARAGGTGDSGGHHFRGC